MKDFSIKEIEDLQIEYTKQFETLQISDLNKKIDKIQEICEESEGILFTITKNVEICKKIVSTIKPTDQLIQYMDSITKESQQFASFKSITLIFEKILRFIIEVMKMLLHLIKHKNKIHEDFTEYSNLSHCIIWDNCIANHDKIESYFGTSSSEKIDLVDDIYTFHHKNIKWIICNKSCLKFVDLFKIHIISHDKKNCKHQLENEIDPMLNFSLSLMKYYYTKDAHKISCIVSKEDIDKILDNIHRIIHDSEIIGKLSDKIRIKILLYFGSFYRLFAKKNMCYHDIEITKKIADS